MRSAVFVILFCVDRTHVVDVKAADVMVVNRKNLIVTKKRQKNLAIPNKSITFASAKA